MNEAEQPKPALRTLLLLSAILFIVFYGLAGIFINATLAGLYGQELPLEPYWTRLVGAALLAWGVLYWKAYRAPLEHGVIIKVGGKLYLLFAVIILLTLLRGEIAGWFWWGTLFIDVVFGSGLLILAPRGTPAIPGEEHQ